MSINVFDTIKQAFSKLNPDDVRASADRLVRVGLFAQSETAYQQMEAFFVPWPRSNQRVLERASDITLPDGPRYDISIYSQEISPPKDGFSFDVQNPEHTVNEILKAKTGLHIPLARHLQPFRQPVAEIAIRNVSKENALFSLATALPDIIPFVELPWAVGEFASDTVVLTVNQVRLAFMLAALSDHEVGYSEQKGEIASILLGAFGWRAIARELVGKIPFGGGLIPKAAVAYAATRVVGMSLDRYYRVGHSYSKSERAAAYQEALEKGKTIAASILENLKRRKLQP